MLPKKIAVSKNDSVIIEWDNDKVSEINKYLLRKSCPCAICKVEAEKNHHDYNLFRGEKTEIINISVVGQHAIKVTWKDGHNAGMYEFQYLIDLAEKGYSTKA
ncbi:MAG: DUF971 domain-containing protein [Bacteroidetes bacterium]|nr:DUF971 domain-containing protein [Bacteroidota bacterium]MBU1113874.1 DUF971 domain-containing protein [Bacteroidota bacterium]MBU1798100.1 DUF971 domain-containing protein [Bacteroidota bacterium]